MRPGQLLVAVVLEPLLGFMLLTLGAVAVATGMVDTGLFAPALALLKAVSIVSALTVLNGTEGLSVRQGLG